MIDPPPSVIDYARARATRLRRKAAPVGVEIRASGPSFALYGPDRGLYLYPRGLGRAVRWLTYQEATAALEHHLAAPTSAG
jgi:hypothetical protein